MRVSRAIQTLLVAVLVLAGAAAVLVTGAVRAPAAHATPAAVGGPPNSMPSAVPSSITPAIDNGAVYSIAQVGPTMVVGGSFTSVAGASRPYVLAFDAASGAVVTGFAPTLDGVVNTVLPGPTSGTVYVGGGFSTVNGATTPYLTLLRLSDGQAVSTFTPPALDGYVNDLVRRGSQLFVGGVFTHADGADHSGLLSLDASSGAVTTFVDLQFTGHHNDSGQGQQGLTGVRAMDANASGSLLVVIGNYKYVDGTLRDQISLLNIGGASAVLAPWATTDYAPLCSTRSIDGYLRGVAFSPDGSYFAVTAKGGGHPGTHCDAVSRFNTTPSNGDAHSVWVDESGGDTMFAVAVTDTAVFFGGHHRWMNNPLGDNAAEPGAVPRPGLGAVDPASGRPLAWNPGRVPLGVAVNAFLVTPQGLWMGSDTDYVGNREYKRPKIALFPWSGGYQVASTTVAGLPGRVFLGRTASTLTRVAFDGTTATPNDIDAQNIDFANWRGAFLVGNKVFYGYSDGYLYVRSFDGTTFGPPVQVDPYHDPAWRDVPTGDGDTFDGVLPAFYASITNLSGMVYQQGRVYYTLHGDAHLYSAWFAPDSGIIDQTIATQTSSVDLSQADGLFVAGKKLYYGSADGALRVVTFANGNVSGTPRVVSGPGADGVDWTNTAMFLGAADGAPNRPPTAAFTASCGTRTCNFRAAGSTDPDGSITSYDWNFGDGSAGMGATPAHVYAHRGNYTVTLVVTDDSGAQASVTHQVQANNARPPGIISFVGAADAGGGSTKTLSVTVPADAATGDTGLLFLTAPTNAGWSAPGPGWQRLDAYVIGSLTTTVWTKTLESSDPGSDVQLTNAQFTHSALTVAVYRGVNASNPVVSFAHQAESASSRHITPYASTAPGAWAVSYWGDRSTGTCTYGVPSAVTVRDASNDSGSFTTQSVVADANGAVASGRYGGIIATTDVPAAATAEWTIVLRPAA